MKKSNSFGIKSKTSLIDGIKKTIEWFAKNKSRSTNDRYNVFKQK